MANKRITVREYDRRAEELIRRIQAEAKPFPDDSDDARDARRKRGQKDMLWFFKTYLPHHFEDDFDDHDKKLVKHFKTWNEVQLIEAFRGWGKSTKAIVGYGVYATVFKLTHYITVTSDTEDQAAELAMPVKVELENNPRIQQDFGNLQSHDWAEDAFVTTSGIKWQCFGWRSKYRGRRFLQYRPGIDFTDDLENDENVRNPQQVKARYDYIMQTKVPAMAEQFQIFVLATKLARRCVTTLLEENPAVKKFILPSEDAKGRPTSPRRFSKERLEKIKKLIGSIAYAKEYLLKIIGDDTSPFQENWIVTIPRALEYKFITSFLDPSAGGGQGNDFKSIVTVGWNGSTYDVLHAWIRKTSIDHMLRSAYRAYETYRWQQMGLETNGFQVLLKREFARAAEKQGYHLPIKPVVQKQNKETRILRLSALVENGLIRFVEGSGDMQLLIDQLLDFPNANHDDGPDALEGAMDLLERLSGNRAEVAIQNIDGEDEKWQKRHRKNRKR